MAKRRVTILDVAKEAGVSVGTASNVFNGKRKVSADKVKKVRDAAEELAYHPSITARSLRSETSNIYTLHIIVPDNGDIIDSTWAFYIPLIQGFSETLNKYNIRLQLEFDRFNQITDIDYLLSFFKGYNISKAAFVISYAHDYSIFKELQNHGIKIISVYSKIDENIPSVKTNHYEASREAVKWLRKMGHSKIAFINGMETHYAAIERRNGYWDEVKGTNYELIYNGDWSIDSGYEGLKHIISRNGSNPSAIFCANDHMAVGAYKACKDLGINIPDDLSIIGFDDNHVARALEPELTTMRMPLFEMGTSAAEFLVSDKEEMDSVLDCKFILRKSVAVKWAPGRS